MIGCLPELTCQLVNVVILCATKAAKEIQARYRTNGFLDRANQELFMPRGLFAMVMSFKDQPPEDSQNGQSKFITKVLTGMNKICVQTERLDIEQALVKYSNPDPGLSKLQKAKKRLRSVQGETTGLLKLPDCAPLVYQYSDSAKKEAHAGKRKGITVIQNLKSAGQWVRDYFDRKAQAGYVCACRSS
ncbi:hypothetical protein N7488_008845 [Penicillium malachiteum]|nr:hypothetical protein N7488_008845 [Penicillium malachiteum]